MRERNTLKCFIFKLAKETTTLKNDYSIGRTNVYFCIASKPVAADRLNFHSESKIYIFYYLCEKLSVSAREGKRIFRKGEGEAVSKNI